MIRALKIAFAANLMVAIIFVGGYIWYGYSTGLRIDQHFLGSGRVKLSRSGGVRVAPWKYDAVAESAILVAFVIGRFGQKDFKVDRVMCLIFGGGGLFTVLISWLLSSTYTGDDFESLHVSPRDCLFGVYVYGSHLLYFFSGLKIPNTALEPAELARR